MGRGEREAAGGFQLLESDSIGRALRRGGPAGTLVTSNPLSALADFGQERRRRPESWRGIFARCPSATPDSESGPAHESPSGLALILVVESGALEQDVDVVLLIHRPLPTSDGVVSAGRMILPAATCAARRDVAFDGVHLLGFAGSAISQGPFVSAVLAGPHQQDHRSVDGVLQIDSTLGQTLGADLREPVAA